MRHVVALMAALAPALAGPHAAAAAPQLVSATFLGTAGDDRLEGVAIAADGSLYVAGNLAEPLRSLPGGAAAPAALGEAVPGWTYGCGFVARLSPDGRRLLAAVQFAPGVARFTTVEAGPQGVYVGGYGSVGLEPLLAPLGGLFPKAHGFQQRDLATYCPTEHHSEPRRDPRNDQRGVPCVLRLSADLARLEAGTFLEGWQSTWHVPWPLGEDHGQPTGLAVLASGDLVVSHDGGYNRFPAPGENAGLEHFYGVPDYVSRLSPDLKRRAWKLDIYTPHADPAKVTEHCGRATPYWRPIGRPWTLDSLGNTRILRLRAGPGDALYIAGWSPTRTSQEPWWSSFLWKLGPDGKVLWRAYNPDPMSGPGDRLGGQVSDAAVRSVAVDASGQVLASLIGDGGNNILRWDPRDYTRPAPNLKGSVSGFRGRVLFWGGVVRLDGQTREVLGGNHLGGSLPSEGRRGGGYQAAWAEDLAPLPGGRVLAVGRNTRGFATTPDAWYADTEGAFVRLYSPAFDVEFSTSVPDFDPQTAAWKGARVAIVGVARPLPDPVRSPYRRPRSDGPPAPAAGAPPLRTPTREALFAAPCGGRDGHLMVLDVPQQQVTK